MSSFREAFSIIPVPAKIIAVVVAVGFPLLLYYCGAMDDPGWKDLPPWGQDLLVSLIVLFTGFMVLVYGYVYGDAKRRGMRAVLWLLLAIFIPNLIGVVLYMFLRDPLPKPCLSCNEAVRPGFAFCPSCGATLKPACPSCKKPIESDWMACAYCGTKLGPGKQMQG